MGGGGGLNVAFKSQKIRALLHVVYFGMTARSNGWPTEGWEGRRGMIFRTNATHCHFPALLPLP